MDMVDRLDKECHDYLVNHKYDSPDGIARGLLIVQKFLPPITKLLEIRKIIDSMDRGGMCWCDVSTGSHILKGVHTAGCMDLKRWRMSLEENEEHATR